MKIKLLVTACISVAAMQSQTVNTFAGTGLNDYNGDNIPATTANLSYPSYLALDNAGNLYVNDNNYRLRKIDSSGMISTIAGNGGYGYDGDNGLAVNATITQPHGIVFDGAGNLYFGDFSNYRIRKIDTAGIITTVAGTGTQGHFGDN